MRAVRTIRFLGFSDTGAPRHSPRDCSTTKLSSSSDLLLPQFSDLKYGVQGDLPSIEFKSWRSISRREERQLEQQFGPLWRYHVLARHGNAPSEATLPVSRDGLGAVVEAATSPTMVASTAPHTSDTPLSNNGNSDDPLAVFIERNEEEAAVLLAMWTSLKRSCFYGSEISEQLSLRVRYIFHTLLHNNAVGAAWALYERLVHVGVSLRHNDLILLLTSLPYESAADRATVEKWIKEEQKNERDRKRERERKAEWELARQRTVQNNINTPVEEEQPDTVETPALQITVDDTALRSDPHHPEWVKRWALYEASMGNLDLDGGMDYSQAGESLRATQQKEANTMEESSVAMKLMRLTAVIDHLAILHTFSVSAAVPPLRQAGASRHANITVAKPSIFKEHAEEFYPTEALRMVNQFVQTHRQETEEPLSLPAELLVALRGLIRFSSWKTCYRYTLLVSNQSSPVHVEDALLFLQRSVRDQPWQKHAKVEQLLLQRILPALATSETAATYAAQSVCLLHLCDVRSTRPDDFASVVALTENSFGDKLQVDMETATLSSLVERAAQVIQLSTSHLHVETKRWVNLKKAERALISSIQSGAFVPRDAVEGEESIAPAEHSVPTTTPKSILPSDLQDVLFILCAVIPQVVHMKLIVDGDQADQVVRLFAFLESVLFGPFSVSSLSNTFLKESKATASSFEGAAVSLRLATCFVQVAKEICRHSDTTTKRLFLNTVKLLLELSLKAVEKLPTSEISRHTVVSLSEFQTLLFVFMRDLQLFLDIMPNHESVIFGSTQKEAVECIVLTTKLLYSVELRCRSNGLGDVKRSREHRVLLGSRRKILQMYYSSNNAVGKQVRLGLSSKEWQWASERFTTNRRYRGHSVTPSYYGIDLQRRVWWRETIYQVILDSQPGELEENILALLKMKPVHERLFVFHLLMNSFCLAKGTFSMTFFQRVLEVEDGKLEKSLKSDGTWLRAVDVYWKAVDHTACRSEVHSIPQHEREVLRVLLPVLLRFSMRIEKRNVGREWRKTWTQKYSASEKQNPEWIRENVMALSILKDHSALEKTIKLTEETKEKGGERDAELLRLAAEGHGNWVAALQALVTVYGEFAEHESMIDPYPLPVAHSLLKILCRADTNLSNTALRLHRIQHTVWDTEASVLLMRILLQARRWDRALEVSEETRKLPDFMALKKRVTSPDAQGMTKEHYTALMLYLNFLSQSLRGCAIGGQSDTASLLFDDVKAVVENMPSATARAKPIQDLSERCRGFFLRAMTKNMMKENSRPKKPVRDDDTHTKEDED